MQSVIVLCGVKYGTRQLLQLFGDIQALTQERLVQQITALIDVEVAQHNQVLVIGIDVAGPIAEPLGDAFNLLDAVIGRFAIDNVNRYQDKRLVTSAEADGIGGTYELFVDDLLGVLDPLVGDDDFASQAR